MQFKYRYDGDSVVLLAVMAPYVASVQAASKPCNGALACHGRRPTSSACFSFRVFTSRRLCPRSSRPHVRAPPSASSRWPAPSATACSCSDHAGGSGAASAGLSSTAEAEAERPCSAASRCCWMPTSVESHVSSRLRSDALGAGGGLRDGGRGCWCCGEAEANGLRWACGGAGWVRAPQPDLGGLGAVGNRWLVDGSGGDGAASSWRDDHACWRTGLGDTATAGSDAGTKTAEMRWWALEPGGGGSQKISCEVSFGINFKRNTVWGCSHLAITRCNLPTWVVHSRELRCLCHIMSNYAMPHDISLA